MADSFLDRLGSELQQAERSLAPQGGRRGVRRPRIGWAVAAVIAVAVAGTGVAATQPWSPVLGRPDKHDVPDGASSSSVPAEVTRHFAILKRAQTTEDRGPAAQRLLRQVGQGFAGVRTASVRLVDLDRDHHVLVVSAVRVANDTTARLSEPICLVTTAGGVCAPANAVIDRGLSMSPGLTTIGLVPDGVTSVRVTFPDGSTARAVVHGNVFRVVSRVPVVRPRVTWLGPDGKVTGPNQ